MSSFCRSVELKCIRCCPLQTAILPNVALHKAVQQEHVAPTGHSQTAVRRLQPLHDVLRTCQPREKAGSHRSL